MLPSSNPFIFILGPYLTSIILIHDINFQLFQINLTLYDFTKNGNKDNYCITVMKQTFDCTREAAKMLQTKLELLMAFQTSKDKIEIGLLGGTSSPSLVGWIKDFESSYQTTTADDGINIVEFLKCVEENS